MPNGEHEPGNHWWAMGPAMLGAMTTAAGIIFGRRKTDLDPAITSIMNQLSALEKRFERLEEREQQNHAATVKLHEEIFALLRPDPARSSGSQS